jgi:hypothetical protein
MGRRSAYDAPPQHSSRSTPKVLSRVVQMCLSKYGSPQSRQLVALSFYLA